MQIFVDFPAARMHSPSALYVIVVKYLQITEKIVIINYQ